MAQQVVALVFHILCISRNTQPSCAYLSWADTGSHRHGWRSPWVDTSSFAPVEPDLLFLHFARGGSHFKYPQQSISHMEYEGGPHTPMWKHILDAPAFTSYVNMTTKPIKNKVPGQSSWFASLFKSMRNISGS